jgi:hypothetical protein
MGRVLEAVVEQLLFFLFFLLFVHVRDLHFPAKLVDFVHLAQYVHEFRTNLLGGMRGCL